MVNLEALIIRQNPQWESRIYPQPEKRYFRREIHAQITNWFNHRLAISISGLRRVGKSTVLKQIKYQLEETVDPRYILYFSFEEAKGKLNREDLREVLDWYFDSFLKIHPAFSQEKIFIFLDEIQYVADWQVVVKTFYDLNPKIKFFVSGSASLYIKNKSIESLAGRIIDLKLPPLTFKEYLVMKNIFPGKEDLNKKFSLIKSRLNSIFEEYLTCGQFPEPVAENFDQAKLKQFLETIEDKIIAGDISSIYKIDEPRILRLLFDLIKNKPGQIIEYQNLANEANVNSKTVALYFDYLAEGNLLELCFNKSKKTLRSARSGKKAYLTSTCFSQEAKTDYLVEDYVFNFLKQLRFDVNFFRFKNFEVDFVIQKKLNEFIPVEVKWQNEIHEEDFRNLVDLSHRLSAKKAILITKNKQEQKIIKGVQINLIPASILENFITLLTEVPESG